MFTGDGFIHGEIGTYLLAGAVLAAIEIGLIAFTTE